LQTEKRRFSIEARRKSRLGRGFSLLFVYAWRRRERGRERGRERKALMREESWLEERKGKERKGRGGRREEEKEKARAVRKGKKTKKAKQHKKSADAKERKGKERKGERGGLSLYLSLVLSCQRATRPSCVRSEGSLHESSLQGKIRSQNRSRLEGRKNKKAQ